MKSQKMTKHFIKYLSNVEKWLQNHKMTKQCSKIADKNHKMIDEITKNDWQNHKMTKHFGTWLSEIYIMTDDITKMTEHFTKND
jgi:hypothetical protein